MQFNLVEQQVLQVIEEKTELTDDDHWVTVYDIEQSEEKSNLNSIRNACVNLTIAGYLLKSTVPSPNGGRARNGYRVSEKYRMWKRGSILPTPSKEEHQEELVLKFFEENNEEAYASSYICKDLGEWYSADMIKATLDRLVKKGEVNRTPHPFTGENLYSLTPIIPAQREETPVAPPEAPKNYRSGFEDGFNLAIKLLKDGVVSLERL